MSIYTRIKEFIERLFGRSSWLVVNCEDIPDKPKPRRVYLVGEPEFPWSAAFLCPCDCGELVQLSLMSNDDPSWIASETRGGRASLHPSVWRIRGCKSHFFIRDGQVIWAREQRPDHRVL